METTALNRVSFAVKPGEFVAIMGPSGCGKSTLLNIVGLLDSPTDGHYYFDGVDVSRFKEKDRTRIRKGRMGFVFQSFNLIDELTVFENIELPLLYLKLPASQRQKRVSEVMERLDILPRRSHFPQQLSGGQQKRAAIASFSGSLLRRTGRSFSSHPQRFNSAWKIRSASALSWRNSPA